MNKIRQFSFQDNLAANSRQNEATLESMSSQQSSRDTLNSFRTYQGFPPPSFPGTLSLNSMNTPHTISHLNTATETLASIRSKEHQDIQKFETVQSAQKNRMSGQFTVVNTKENPSNENLDPQSSHNIIHMHKNSGHKGSTTEITEKIEKVQQMLEKHREKKKSESHSRAPLTQINENANTSEIIERVQFDTVSPPPGLVSEEKVQGSNLKSRQSFIPTDSDQVDIYEVSYRYHDQVERPEQTFSPIENQSYNPNLSRQSMNKVTPLEVENREVQQEEIRVTPSHVSQEDAKTKKKTVSSQNKKVKAAAAVAQQRKESLQESQSSRNYDRRIPIEERLRLKDQEKEARMMQLREERSRDDMRNFQSKPQISENSKIIAMYSKRAIENARVYEMLEMKKEKMSLYSRGVSQNSSQFNKISERKGSRGRLGSVENYGGSVSNIENSRGFHAMDLSKKRTHEVSVSSPIHEAINFETFQPYTEPTKRTESKEGLDTNGDYQQMIRLEDDNVQMMGSLQHSNSSKSLHKEAADRLALAIARKSNAKQMAQSPNDVQKIREKTFASNVPGFEVTNSCDLNLKKNNIHNAPHVKIGTEASSNNYSLPSDQRKSPKQVYLRFANQLFEEGFDRRDPAKNFVNNLGSVQSSIQQRDGQSSRLNTENIFEIDYERIQTPELTNEEAERVQTKESVVVEARKRSVRQPTFGISNSNHFTHFSSKMNNSMEGSPDKVRIQTRESRENLNCDEVLQNHLQKKNANKCDSKPTRESLLNSLKLRQQKLNIKTQPSSVATSQSYQSFKKQPNLLIDQNSLLDIDVYMRNAIWLSVKNSKVAAQQTNRDIQNMKECTFHPHIFERVTKSGLTSPNRTFKTTETKSNKKQAGFFNKPVASYKSIHGIPVKKEEVKEKVNPLVMGDAITGNPEEPKISVELREDGQKYYLL